ncbi:hypothetical protein JCM3774_005242 [Rhodotorula dairenensis]
MSLGSREVMTDWAMPTLASSPDAEMRASSTDDDIELVAPAFSSGRPQAQHADTQDSLEKAASEKRRDAADVQLDLEEQGSRTRKRSASSVSAVGEWVGMLSGRIRGWTRGASDGSATAISGGTPTLPPGVQLGPVGPWDERFDSWLVRVRARRPRIGRALIWLRGPSPPWIETELPVFPLPFLGPWLHRFELWCSHKLAPMRRWRQYTTPVFLLAWLLGFIFLVRASFFTETNTSHGTPTWIGATDSYWYADTGCGINGTACDNTVGSTFVFRCPSLALDVRLLNDYAIGAESIIYDPLIVGGFDSEQTYRADSWICAAAIQHGLFTEHRGGCGQLELVGEFTGYVGGRQHGVKSQSFDTTFPSSYRFLERVSQTGCQDLRDDILGFDVAMSTIFSFFIRPSPQAWFWVLLCVGAWHNALASDPVSMPPDLELAFERFAPVLFVGAAFWRHAWRWVAPAFDNSGYILERTVWYLAGFWVGILMNVSLDWIPINRLTPHDIQQEPGGLVAVIVLVIFLVAVVLNQLRVIRRTGWFFYYLKWYAVGGAVIGVLAALPGLELRLHHWIAAVCLMPGTAFVTRPSAIFQGFLLGMFIDGAMRWGLDSILQSAASLVGDGAIGSPLPAFMTNSTNFASYIAQGVVAWAPISDDLAAQGYDSFALLVDDVYKYSGRATNYSLAGLDSSLVHYFRLAYEKSGTVGDFTKAATAFISNATWIDPRPGPS